MAENGIRSLSINEGSDEFKTKFEDKIESESEFEFEFDENINNTYIEGNDIHANEKNAQVNLFNAIKFKPEKKEDEITESTCSSM